MARPRHITSMQTSWHKDSCARLQWRWTCPKIGLLGRPTNMYPHWDPITILTKPIWWFLMVRFAVLHTLTMGLSPFWSQVHHKLLDWMKKRPLWLNLSTTWLWLVEPVELMFNGFRYRAPVQPKKLQNICNKWIQMVKVKLSSNWHLVSDCFCM